MNEIDLVIPMVFPSDKEWRKEHARCVGGDAAGHVRFRSWGTEELLVRCVRKYMPWVRRVYLLLAGEGQVQEWMVAMQSQQTGRDTYAREEREGQERKPEVRVVFHREFIPAEYLPCFSSPCIEMFLHRIPGLSERFIYGNDDMFPLSPLEVEDFFRVVPRDNDITALRDNGRESGALLPCQHFAEKPYPASPNIFQRKCMYQQNMVGRPFGKHFTTTWLKNGHSMAPLLKSSCEEVWRRHGAEITANVNPLRRTDRSFNQYLYALYQHFAGLCVDYVPKRQYIGRGTATENIAAIIRDPDCGILCLNDNEKIMDWERRAEIVRREIEWKLVMTK